jgi:putative FmdB family regulatory protein
MPLYEFYCFDCSKYYEIIIKLKDYDKKPKCPHCGKELKKLMSAPMFKIN